MSKESTSFSILNWRSVWFCQCYPLEAMLQPKEMPKVKKKRNQNLIQFHFLLRNHRAEPLEIQHTWTFAAVTCKQLSVHLHLPFCSLPQNSILFGNVDSKESSENHWINVIHWSVCVSMYKGYTQTKQTKRLWKKAYCPLSRNTNKISSIKYIPSNVYLGHLGHIDSVDPFLVEFVGRAGQHDEGWKTQFPRDPSVQLQLPDDQEAIHALFGVWITL